MRPCEKDLLKKIAQNGILHVFGKRLYFGQTRIALTDHTGELKATGLIEEFKSHHFKITEKGKKFLKNEKEKVNSIG